MSAKFKNLDTPKHGGKRKQEAMVGSGTNQLLLKRKKELEDKKRVLQQEREEKKRLELENASLEREIAALEGDLGEDGWTGPRH